MSQKTGDMKTKKQNNQMENQEKKLKSRMNKVKHKIAVISGKGGVGKSTVTVNLATALALHKDENHVGILDADIHGPSIPKILGLMGERLQAGPAGIFPATGPLGIKVISMEFLLANENAPVIWRGPLKMGVIRQFLSDVVWGDLDFLLADLPPGTGDEPLSIAQLLPEMDGVIIVTIPSEVSQIVVKKAVTFARQLKLPIIGIIENMSGFACPTCGTKIDIFSSGGGKKISEEMGVPFLGSIPIDQNVCSDSDKGTPFIITHKESPATKAFIEIVKKVEDFLKKNKIKKNMEKN